MGVCIKPGIEAFKLSMMDGQASLVPFNCLSPYMKTNIAQDEMDKAFHCAHYVPIKPISSTFFPHQLDERKLIILRGVSGSGKTSFARTLQENMEQRGVSVVRISTDDLFDVDGAYVFNPAELKSNHEKALKLTGDYLQSGTTVILDNTNVRLRHIKPYVDLATALRLTFQIVPPTVILAEWDNMTILEQRRVERTDKSVPEQVVRKQIEDFEFPEGGLEMMLAIQAMSTGIFGFFSL